MYKRRNVLIFGNEQECENAMVLLKNQFSTSQSVFRYDTVSQYNELYQQIADVNPNIVFVLADGANGMECVYQTKKYDEDVLVFWFSDDRNFGMQSHRMECTYFAEKPLNTDKLKKAMAYCQNIGISF